MLPDKLASSLCEAFCSDIRVRAVPAGLALSTAFKDSSGDPIEFYLVEDTDGFRLEDDGMYLSHVHARDIPINRGHRAQLLDAILEEGGASVDWDTFQISSSAFGWERATGQIVSFLSALIRTRDLELWTQNVVKSTFKDDAAAAIENRFGDTAEIVRDEPLSDAYADTPADMIMVPKSPGGHAGAIFFANSNERLTEALLMQSDMQHANDDTSRVIALVEDPNFRGISRFKFQRAQNRGLPMPIFRGDEAAALRQIGRVLNLSPAVAGS